MKRHGIKTGLVLLALVVAVATVAAVKTESIGYITKRLVDTTMQNEIQTVTVTAGNDTDSFTLTFSDGGAQTTAALDWDCTSAEMVTALEALTNIGVDQVAITESDGVYTITFQGTLASSNVGQLTSTPTGCTVAHATTQVGLAGLLVRSGEGVLHSVAVTVTPGTGGNLTIYDGLTSAGTVLAVIAIPNTLAAPYVLTGLDWRFRTGLYVDRGALVTFGVTLSYS